MVEGSVTIPDLTKIRSIEDLRKLKITKVQWYSTFTIGFTLNDQQFVKAGTEYNFEKSFIFDPSKKITRIETIIEENELSILQINFYSNQERLVTVGISDDGNKKYNYKAGRVEVFTISADEQLIGC